jgi:peptidyl-prolyl cis-trans isomerase B (cyclophilin B)
VIEEGQPVSPSSREREYARRRYQEWQDRQAAKRAQQRRRRQQLTIAAAAVAVVAVIVAGVLLLNRGGGTTTASASATPSATASGAASASVSASAGSTAGPNPCPTPTVKPPATPQSFAKAPDPSLAQAKAWTMTITTSCGDVVAELDGAKAPKAVANAIFLSGKKFWDGSPCHRLGAEGLNILQCGDPTGTGTGGPGYEFGPVENAPADGVYKAGVIAMARAQSETSQGSQFFIVFKDTTLPGGYTVFGRVTKGLDVITKIAAGGVGTPSSDGSGPPARPLSIVSTQVVPG